MNGIQNIIFDLGGVILDIDFQLTEAAFRRLGWQGFATSITQHPIAPLFADYETGRITSTEFLSEVRRQSGLDAPDEVLTRAWNALLKEFPLGRLEFLESLKGKYRLFLLSNTNALHYEAFQQKMRQQRGHDLDYFFEKAYYSHLLQMRKPHAEIYRHVLDQHGLDPAQTLFVDDSLLNLKAAEQLGIRIFHAGPRKSILDMGL